jgi:hypothetical protein
MNEIHAAGDWQTLNRWRAAIFGVSTAGNQRADGVTDAPLCDVAAHLFDDACDLQARDVGRARRRRVFSEPLHHIRMVYARSVNLDEHAVRRSHRPWPLCGHKDIGGPGLSDFNGDHAFLSSW